TQFGVKFPCRCRRRRHMSADGDGFRLFRQSGAAPAKAEPPIFTKRKACPMQTQVLPVNEQSIALAAQLLRRGELVALPTETVYGIAADARNPEAVKKIFAAKGRPQDNPLIVHIAGMEMLAGIVSAVPERARRLAAAFWPGPLTMVLPRGPEVADVTCAGLDTVGVRVPS